MPKYNFPGIKEKGAKGIEMLLSYLMPAFAGWLKAPVVGYFIDGEIQVLTNYLANEGLVLLNIGDILIEGKFDQDNFDKVMDQAIIASGFNPDTLTEAQKKKIDDGVRNALRRFGPLHHS